MRAQGDRVFSEKSKMDKRREVPDDVLGQSKNILSVDFGTSALKISILNRNLRTLQSEKEEYPYVILPGEKVEMSPDSIWKALRDTCGRMTAARRETIGLFCFDTYSPSLVLMDENGTALHNVVTHMDRRSRKQSEFIREKMGEDKFQSIAGVYPFTGGISLTTLLWFMQEDKNTIAQTKRIGHLPTFLYKKLTGIWAVDFVNASMMGLYDTVRQSGWSDEILDTFGIPRAWLSDIHMPGEILGNLLPEVAGELGLPADVPVAMGTNDVVAAHAGAGNFRSGQILDTAGSSDMVSILTDKPLLHPKYYVRNAGFKGLWQIYATTCGGFAIDWFYNEFCREMSKDDFYNSLIPEALECIGKTPVTFDPYLAECRQSLERRTASWKGLTLGSTRKEMLASLLDSMQTVLSDTVACASESTGMDSVIKITGGMTADSIMKLKARKFPGYTFEHKDDCCVLGNPVLAHRKTDTM